MKKVLAIFLALFISLSLCACGTSKVKDNTDTEKDSASTEIDPIILSTENHTVDTDMMTYYFFSEVYNFYNQYGAYLGYMGASLDTTTSLKEQTSVDGQSSWYDYFLNSATLNIKNFLLFAEAATNAGFEVEDLQTMVDEEINYLVSSAESSGTDFETYLSNLFGETVTEEVVRKAIELQILAYQYYVKLSDEYRDSITDEQYETYYTENKNTFDKVDLLSYTLSAEYEDGADEATTTAAYEAAKADAEALMAAAATKDAYVAWVSANLTEANADLETPLTEDEIKAQAEYVTEGQGYTEGDKLSEWAFAADRKAGDVTLIDDGAGNYTVYMMEKTAYRVETEASRDVRHILVKTGGELSDEDAKAKADDILAQYLAGEKTAEAFDALAQEYNEDSNSLYEGVTKGQMVAEFENWLFDETRVVGDTGVVQTQYGYHVMYLEATAEPQWKEDAYNAMFEVFFTETVEGFEKDYPITENKDGYDLIPDSIPQAEDTAEDTSSDTTVDTSADTTEDTSADSAEIA